MESTLQITVLDDGLTVMSESLPTVSSVSIGVWIKTGSRLEAKSENGIAHFIEHLVFKGTKHRSALQIARALEDVGGSLNAFTTRELTCYYTYSLSSHLRNCVSVLSDLVCHPLFRDKDIELERGVILEELRAMQDIPEEYIFDLFQEQLFPDQPIGRPILGKEETIRNLKRDQILSFYQRHYSTGNVLVCAAGNLRHEQLVSLVKRYFRLPLSGKKENPVKASAAKAHLREKQEDINQTHLLVGVEALPYHSPQRYALIALNQYLGGGMSSRLFQQIREKRGLAYTIYGDVHFFLDTGVCNFYMGLDHDKRELAIDLLFREIRKIKQKPLSDSILRRLREQLLGNYLLAMENTYRRMSNLARNLIYLGRPVTKTEIIKALEELSARQIQETAQRVFAEDKFHITVLRPHA